MNKYELTVVLPGKTAASKKKAVCERIKKLVTTFKGKVGKSEDWGEKELAYKIEKNETGFFLFFPLELSSESVGSISTKLRLDEDIIRHLLVKN